MVPGPLTLIRQPLAFVNELVNSAVSLDRGYTSDRFVKMHKNRGSFDGVDPTKLASSANVHLLEENHNDELYKQ